MTANWIDRMALAIAPKWGLSRMRARMAANVIQRHYEAASAGRRTQGWRRSSGDANSVIESANKSLREVARDLVRNNSYAASALSTIEDQGVGWGIVPLCPDDAAMRVWEEWAETKACDADGRRNIYGLMRLALRCTAESGEALLRGRVRRLSDGLPVPFQLQLLEPDYLDSSREQITNRGGARIIQGVEFDALGRRVGYYLFREHPGSTLSTSFESERVPADFISHLYVELRPGQVRGVSWFAPVILTMKDLDEMEDATLIKQKIAACLAAFTLSSDGAALPMGHESRQSSAVDPIVDTLGPGAVIPLAHGQDVKIVEPPAANDYPEYTKQILRKIATGIGVAYEDLTGDYTGMPFSAARMSRLRQWSRVEGWREHLLVQHFCQPVWDWVMSAAVVAGRLRQMPPPPEWMAPPLPMIDPVHEGLAYQRNIRNGIQSLSEVLRERGYDPKKILKQIANDNRLIDELGLILDSDPRKTTQAGQLQGEGLNRTADAVASQQALDEARRAWAQ